MVVLHVERAAHVELGAVLPRELQRDAHSLVAVRRAVHADHEGAALERAVVAHHQHVLLDAAQRPPDDPAELAEVLPAQPVGADRDEVVVALGGARELLVVLLVLGDQPAVLAHLDVGADALAAVVLVGDVGVEADEGGQAPLAAVRLLDDLLEVDALQELPGQRNAGFLAAQVHLVQEAVGDELEALLDKLVVDLPLPLDLLGLLELRGEPHLELPEADIVQAGGVDVRAGDAPLGAPADLDRAVDREVGFTRVVHGDEDFSIEGGHRLRLSPSRIGRVRRVTAWR